MCPCLALIIDLTAAYISTRCLCINHITHSPGTQIPITTYTAGHPHPSQYHSYSSPTPGSTPGIFAKEEAELKASDPLPPLDESLLAATKKPKVTKAKGDKVASNKVAKRGLGSKGSRSRTQGWEGGLSDEDIKNISVASSHFLPCQYHFTLLNNH
jgi:hypothetical protein